MERIEELIRERSHSGLLRRLRPATCRKEGKIFFDSNQWYIDFSSNDYLGLSNHPKIKEATKKIIDELGTSSSASRLLSGDLTIHHRLEEKVAIFKSKEAALVFNSGYQANVSIISALYKNGDAIFCDRLCHASIIDGILLSGARFFRFFHNNTSHLESLLKKERGKFKDSLIITESVFSMDGDKPSLKELVEIKERYNCSLLVDEAHATGIFGKNGAGVVEEYNLTDKVEFIMGTFGKALGGFGAYLACSQDIKKYLINFCRGFIYSTALPPPVIASDMTALDVIGEESFRRKVLLENADYFRNRLVELGFNIKGCSQIIPLIIGDAKKTIAVSRELEQGGYWVAPIRPPTVEAGQSRLRFSLTYYHNKEILEGVANELYKIIRP